ncbi:hypothetical protein PoB_001073300 [Plakobranchus ocellatus]|uniref:Uncharacterized protein n=1 Tax=Plakobranchus ocellatus TaxID=259542 RepID=A0AAV3YNT7_9GAST|nr:hypothetical protein PoB_001073300 [Plakobranchus ocellatus]
MPYVKNNLDPTPGSPMLGLSEAWGPLYFTFYQHKENARDINIFCRIFLIEYDKSDKLLISLQSLIILVSMTKQGLHCSWWSSGACMVSLSSLWAGLDHIGTSGSWYAPAAVSATATEARSRSRSRLSAIGNGLVRLVFQVGLKTQKTGLCQLKITNIIELVTS